MWRDITLDTTLKCSGAADSYRSVDRMQAFQLWLVNCAVDHLQKKSGTDGAVNVDGGARVVATICNQIEIV